MNFRKNMSLLRILSDEYYQGKITFVEYRNQRSHLLALIDEELNGVKDIKEIDGDDKEVSTSLVDKALSFLKIEQQQDS